MKLKYIVTGTGRCGTVFFARVLSSIGIPCGHEVIFDPMGIQIAGERLQGKRKLELSLTSRLLHKDGQPELIDPYIEDLNNLQADSSYMAAPYLNHHCLKDATVIHVVRNPIMVVNSFINYLGYFSSIKPTSKIGELYEKYIYDHMPELKEDMTTYERAALYYVKWNSNIEWNAKDKQYIRLRAEEGSLPLLNWLGLPVQNTFDDRSINTYKKACIAPFALEQIPKGYIKDQFIEIGRRYGYNLSIGGVKTSTFL